MRPAGIPKLAGHFALPDICVPLCILKTSYYVPACEKDGKTFLRGEGQGRGHLHVKKMAKLGREEGAWSSACEKDGQTPSRGEGAGSSACEKDGQTPSWGEEAGSSAIFLCPHPVITL